MRTRLLALGILLAVSSLLILSFGALAAPEGQVAAYSTPTPGPDGRIIYIVQPGDNCIKISLLNYVSVDYLRQTNHLDENCTLIQGQQLVIGIGGPSASSPTPGPSPTPTPILPTATPSSGGLAQICVALYNDADGDGIRLADTDALGNYLAPGTDPIVPDGAISLTSLTGTYSQTLTTVAGLDPVCFRDIPAGKYTVSAGIPDGYNPTTLLSDTLSINAGDSAYVNFGAQRKVEPSEDQTSKRSPLMGILGAIFLLAGAGLGAYAWRSVRKK